VRIALFATCLADTMFPQAAQATVTILERLGHQVCFPEGQVCCGQMHANTGYFKQAAKITRNHVETFSPVLDGEWDAIVIPSGSCTGAARPGAGLPDPGPGNRGPSSGDRRALSTQGPGPPSASLASVHPFLVPAWFPRSLPAMARRRR